MARNNYNDMEDARNCRNNNQNNNQNNSQNNNQNNTSRPVFGTAFYILHILIIMIRTGDHI